ncbi:uncharacterized protein LOC130625865 [Hydractinia symbiolongicarpus]|uniref:uncharacterized protein LOC130625865 n=1 Tax=Hydractinia symbiolongicarpus TaxID=13093 RepID=UPI00254C5361|nr:uncharacterized protein LOC130625865 [Hydractinia symbiolongicarpus]
MCGVKQQYKLNQNSQKLLRYGFLVIGIALCFIRGVEATTTCLSHQDCKRFDVESCCMAVSKHNGVCNPMLARNAACRAYSVKLVLFGGGGYGVNYCGCKRGLICKKIERKNWAVKERRWSEDKKRFKKKYKYRCKPIQREAVEIQELE